MRTVNVYEAKTNLSQLLAEVEGGERIEIARAGKPVAMLSPVPYRATPEEVERRFGALRGRAHVPDDFDTMMADEIREMFEGKYDGGAQ